MSGVAITTDHLAWQRANNGQHPVRLAKTVSGTWLVNCAPSGHDFLVLQGSDRTPPGVVQACGTDLPAGTPAQLREQLGALGTVHRMTNPWMWDALATAIFRQMARPGQARVLYQKWCQVHGQRPGKFGRLIALSPGPRTVLELSDQQFSDCGAAFRRTALRAAATAYLRSSQDWERLKAPDLSIALDKVPGIGPWTARVAAADYTGDYSVYPNRDQTIRTSAMRAAPEHPWPDKRRFGAHWRALAGGDTRQLHALTLMTLAWGTHIRAQLDLDHSTHASPVG